MCFCCLRQTGKLFSEISVTCLSHQAFCCYAQLLLCVYHRSGMVPSPFSLNHSWKENSSQEEQTHNRREGIAGSFSVHSLNHQMRKRKRCHSSIYDLAGKGNNRISSLCSMYELNVNAVVFQSCQHKCCFLSLQKSGNSMQSSIRAHPFNKRTYVGRHTSYSWRVTPSQQLSNITVTIY